MLTTSLGFAASRAHAFTSATTSTAAGDDYSYASSASGERLWCRLAAQLFDCAGANSVTHAGHDTSTSPCASGLYSNTYTAIPRALSFACPTCFPASGAAICRLPGHHTPSPFPGTTTTTYSTPVCFTTKPGISAAVRSATTDRIPSPQVK
jgi:hypothetical protein